MTGIISGAQALTKSGSNTLYLGITDVPVNNTYSGGTTINAGVIYVNARNDSAMGTGAVTLSSGTMLTLNRIAFANSLVSNGGTLRFKNAFVSNVSGAITVNAPLTVSTQYSDHTISGAISGASGITLIQTATGGGLIISRHPTTPSSPTLAPPTSATEAAWIATSMA